MRLRRFQFDFSFFFFSLSVFVLNFLENYSLDRLEPLEFYSDESFFFFLYFFLKIIVVKYANFASNKPTGHSYQPL